MDADYDLFNLKTNIEQDVDENGQPTGKDDGYKQITNPDARSYALKAIALLSDAAIVKTVPSDKANRNARSAHNDKERVAMGLEAQNDERLRRLMMAEGLQGDMSWKSCVRGYITGRHVLVKPPDGGPAYPDITPWDPKRVSWATGSRGISWAIHTVDKTRGQIKEEYGVKTVEGADETKTDDEEIFEVFDYYDGTVNKVCTKDQVLKKATPHGSNNIPVHIVPVGATPIVVPREGQAEIEHVGESVYNGVRDIYPKENLVLSILYELAARSLRPVVIIRSPDGSVTIDEDPFKSGSRISYPEGVTIEVLPLHEAAADTGALLGLIDSMKQRASLPNSAFGELQFTLSGFAINSLSQGISTVIKPMIKAMETAYFQIYNDLIDQYTSGGFDPIELTGHDNNKEWFSATIDPDDIRELPPVFARVTANLPKDDVAKLGMALSAKQFGLDDRTILEDILEYEDPDQILDRMKEQRGQTATPVAMAFQLARAAFAEGEIEMATIYQRLFEVEVLKQEASMLAQQNAAMGLIEQIRNPQPQQPSGALRGGILGPDGQPARMDPRVAPNAILGAGPPEPNQQNGPLVPPGTPRPGAQNGAGPLG
tara:strand:- start:2669 stop:4465 length:1797 start_codon:yes stop_codon:yes gene_type:complete